MQMMTATDIADRFIKLVGSEDPTYLGFIRKELIDEIAMVKPEIIQNPEIMQNYDHEKEYYFMENNKIMSGFVIGGNTNINFNSATGISTQETKLLIKSKNEAGIKYHDNISPEDIFSSKEDLIYSLGYNIPVHDKEMYSFSQYESIAMSTRKYPKNREIFYPALKLNGEAGEVADKVGKIMRDKNEVFSEDDKKELMKEVGDCLWYLAAIAKDLGYTLEDAAKMNVRKITDRRARGVVGGSGDNR